MMKKVGLGLFVIGFVLAWGVPVLASLPVAQAHVIPASALTPRALPVFVVTSPLTPSVTSSPSPTVTLSSTRPLTYTLSFPVVSSPVDSSYRAPSPFLKYIPFIIILMCIIGLVLLKRKKQRWPRS